jgi:hypothetical protein
MKHKKIIILLLILSLILPFHQSSAGPWNWFSGIGKSIVNFLSEGVQFAENVASAGISWVLYIISAVFHSIIFTINENILAPLVNRASSLDPFINPSGGNQPAAIFWNIIKNFSYILLVFSGLAAAYEYLIGSDAQAKKLIFNIIIVALLINFSFLLVESSFKIVRNLENGLTGGSAEQIGNIIVASLWQKDPLVIVKELGAQIQNDNSANKYLIQAILYLFIIVFDMIITIVLTTVLVLFIVRYVMLVILAGTSSLAFASLTIPEFKGALGEALSGFRIFNNWLSQFINWLLVIPIFVILVILGNVLSNNTITQVTGDSIVQFIFLMAMLTYWYLYSIKIANGMAGKAAAIAKGAAKTALVGIGTFALGKILYMSGGKVGNFLKNTATKLENRLGTGGTLGWRSWVGQKIVQPTKKAGEGLIERRYRLEAATAKERIATIDEQLKKTTDPGQIQALTSQLSQLIQKYQGNDYVLKSINEHLRGMSSSSAAKILQQQGFLQIMTDPQTSQETQEAIAELIKKVSAKDADTLISNQAFLQTAGSQQSHAVIQEATAELINKLKKSNFKSRMNDLNWIQGLQNANISPEVINAIKDRIDQDFKEEDVIDFMSDSARINAINNLPQIKNSLNKASKNFLDAVIKTNANAAADALSKLGKNFWHQTDGISNKIHQILQNKFSQADIENTLLGAIANADKETQEAILLRVRTDSGQAKSILSNLFKPSPIVGPTGQSVLTPQQQRAQNIMSELTGRAQAIIKASSF